MNYLKTVLVINFSLIINIFMINCLGPKFSLRKEFVLKKEQRMDLNQRMRLTPREKKANEIIMKAKNEEYENGINNSYKFNPSRHIFEVLGKINSSNLFKILKKMPKGGVLNINEYAMCDPDYLVSLTYRDYLWQTYNFRLGQVAFQFSRTRPAPNRYVAWYNVTEERSEIGAEKYDSFLRGMLTLNTGKAFRDTNEAWMRYRLLYTLITPLITYAPIFKEYFLKALKEIYEDNVAYTEFRGSLPPVYNLEGDILSPIEVVGLYASLEAKFYKKYHSKNYIGTKFIYAPDRNGDIDEQIEILREIHAVFPNFVVGFDLFGHEDKGRPLIDIIEKLLELPKTIKLVFNAGYTNWYGTKSDENLIDAILLGSKRIVNGLALIKHPLAFETVIREGIPIEINPISSQVLRIVDDLRIHPCAVMIANNVSIVISSGSPSFFDVSPLTHDFYETFLGIASKHHDLRLLKTLAYNSLFYSSLKRKDKEIAINSWRKNWNQWIIEILK